MFVHTGTLSYHFEFDNALGILEIGLICFKKLFLEAKKHQVNEAEMSELLKQNWESWQTLRKVSML